MHLLYLQHKELAPQKIKEYIKNQLKEDELGEQLTFNNTDPFMGSK